MIKVLGVSVLLYCLCLVVLGILLFLYSAHGLEIEGFQVGGRSGSGSGSGSYITGPEVFVKDCTGTTGSRRTTGSVTECVSIGKNTDRLTYLQRLPVGGSLLSANGRYSLKYRADGMLILYDMATITILWRSNTRGTSTLVASHLINIGAIQARSIYDTVMPWIAVSASGSGSSSGSGSGSGSGSSPPPTYSIPSNSVTTTSAYLQVTDYGDLVVFNAAGSTLWRSNTGDPPPPPRGCIPVPMIYPFTQEDCFELKSILEKNAEVINGTADVVEAPLVANITPNVYMPLYTYIFGDWILANNAPLAVTVIKVVGGVNIYIVEMGQTLKMVADDSVGTAKYYTVPAGAAWSGSITSWNDAMWTSGTSAGTRSDGHYMLHAEGVPIKAVSAILTKPTFIKTPRGRPISMYGSQITNKLPVSATKKVGEVMIYICETFTNHWDRANILMVADDAVGTAKVLAKTGTISIATWADSYWTTATSMGVRTDGRYKIDKDEIFQRSSQGSGSQKPLSRTSDIIAAKASLCNLQPYYNDKTSDNPNGLGCAAYLVSNPNPSSKWKINTGFTSTTGGAAITPPNVTIRGSIANLSDQLIPNMDLTRAVKVNDMIYLGYLLDVQGPFVVSSITPTIVTFTKKYFGPNLTNSIISVVASVGFSGRPAQSTVPLTGPSGPNEKEVYAFGDSASFTLATAKTACESFGGTVATYNQLVDAQSIGAHWCWYTLVQDDTNGNPRVAFPIQTSGTCIGAAKGVSEKTATTAALACYGVKPREGTTYTIPGTATKIPILKFSTPFSPTGTPNDSTVQTLYNAPSLIDGSIYAGTNYITTTNSILPDSLDIGDIIYLEAPCNKYDTDLGDGTCRAYDCNVGEVDTLQNNECQTYRCRGKVNNEKDHIKNSNGTCTVPDQYTPCPKTYEGSSRELSGSANELVTELSDGNICTYNIGVPRTKTYNLRTNSEWKENVDRTYGNFDAYWGGPYLIPNDETPVYPADVGGPRAVQTYSVKQSLSIPSFTYDIIEGGVRGPLVTKTTSNPSYIYPKELGPFIVAFVPSINNIMIRSYDAGGLDANGKFFPVSSEVSRSSANAMLATMTGKLASANTALTSANAALTSANTTLTSANAELARLTTISTNTTEELRLLTASATPVIIELSASLKGFEAQPVTAAAYNRHMSAMDASRALGTLSADYVTANKMKELADKVVIDAANIGPASTAAARASGIVQTASITASNAQSLVNTYTARIASLTSAINALGGGNGVIQNRVPAFTGRQNIRIYKSTYESTKTPASGSTGPKVSLTKKILGCPVGTFGADCAPCPAGKYTLGQYNAGIDNSQCSTCPAGYYCAGATNAMPCAAGHSSSTGQASCTACRAGQTSYDAGLSCSPCAAGYYCIGASAPAACLPGLSSAAGSSSCSTCTAGYYCSGGTVPALCRGGEYSLAGAASCSQCPTGRYSAPGASSCFTCPAGNYLTAGNTRCLKCEQDTYSNAGDTSCGPCAPGLYSNPGDASCSPCSYGATSISCLGKNYTWTNNQDGFLDVPGFSMTLPSVVGVGEPFTVEAIIPGNPASVLFVLTTANRQTHEFTVYSELRFIGFSSVTRYIYTFPGSYSVVPVGESYGRQVITIYNGSNIYSAPSVGEAVVMTLPKCTKAQRYNTSTSSCTDCPAGTTSGAGNKLLCTPCVAGTYAAAGETSCKVCPVGTYSAAGASACTECAPGTSSSVEGAASCSPCAQGTTSPAGAISCAPAECVTGTTSANCLPYTNTIKETGVSVSGPYVIRRGDTTSFTVTGAAPGYAQQRAPYDIQWLVDGVQQFNTCTSPSTCTFTIPAAYRLPDAGRTAKTILIQMRSGVYNLPILSIPTIP